MMHSDVYAMSRCLHARFFRKQCGVRVIASGCSGAGTQSCKAVSDRAGNVMLACRGSRPAATLRAHRQGVSS